MLLWNSLSRWIRRPATRWSGWPGGPARDRPRSARPRLEILEDRSLLSTFLVDHLADDTVGSGLNGSLRYCITHGTDGDSIQFGVTGTINLTGALPDLTHSVSIQGPGANLSTVRRGTDGFTASSRCLVAVARRLASLG
jgi:hypothetical protein